MAVIVVSKWTNTKIQALYCSLWRIQCFYDRSWSKSVTPTVFGWAAQQAEEESGQLYGLRRSGLRVSLSGTLPPYKLGHNWSPHWRTRFSSALNLRASVHNAISALPGLCPSNSGQCLCLWKQHICGREASQNHTRRRDQHTRKHPARPSRVKKVVLSRFKRF